MNEKSLEKDLQNDDKKLIALTAAAQIISNMSTSGFDGVIAFLTFRIATLKCIDIVPRDMEGRRGMQDTLLSNLRSELRLLEDKIMAERMKEDNV